MASGGTEHEPAGVDHDDPPTGRGSRISRRALLLGGAGAIGAVAVGGALVSAGARPGRTRVRTLLGLDGDDGSIPEVDPGPMASGSFRSRQRDAATGWAVSYPPGSADDAHLPVLVALHGKGGDHTSTFEDLGMDRFLADAVRVGSRPFAIASVDGGDTYWHARADGTDSGAMVVEELLPLLADRGLDTRRLGFFGWSMGGYGSLLLASQAATPPVRAVGTLSAALWTDPGSSAPGAFDDADDFAAHDVFAHRPPASLPLRMDCGEDDPFAAANRSFRDGSDPTPQGGFQAGAHTAGYWRRMLPSQLAFLGPRLTAQ